MKLIRINLSSKQIKEEIIDLKHPLFNYAGRSLSSKIISDEVPVDVLALNQENKLIFASGFLGGTTAPNSGRISVGCKSPLTNGVKEANVGGRAPAYLARLDIRGLIFEGKSDDWVILHINENEIHILDGSKYQGKNNYDLMTQLLAEYPKKSGIFSIGTAGEKQLKAASIASADMEGYPSRHAGRGGVGAVMGSKLLKAIVIEPPSKIRITYQNKDQFKRITKEWGQNLYKAKRGFSKFGTAIGLMTMNTVHGLPTKNFRKGSFAKADQISGKALNDFLIKNKGQYGIPCSPGCVIQCSNLVKDSNGNHITSSLEYETIALNGSNLEIGSIEKLAEIDHLCDDLGVDTIEIGNAIGVFMETGKIKWGDADVVIQLIKNINQNLEDSLLIGNGAVAVGKHYNISRVAQVKGQGISGYDPRSFKGMGVTYLTSPMGADHTAGAAIKGRKAYTDKDYGELIDPEIKVELSRDLQIFTMLLDSMGQCYFVGPSWDTTEKLSELMNLRYGLNLNPNELKNFGIEWLEMERVYNEKCGLSSISEFPKFIQDESLEDIERKWDIPPSELKKFWENLD